MGYRSTVFVVTAKTTEWPEAVQSVLNDIAPIKENKNYRYWTDTYLKWYADYEDVKQVEQWLASLAENQYGFIRIGEDFEDVETRGEPWEFGANVQRTIDFEK